MSGFSTTDKNEILDASVGKATYKNLLEYYLALATILAVPGDTGGTITEPTYTGYGRIPMKAADWTAGAEGAHHNANTMLFAECTAGESAVVGWVLCEKKLKGEAGKIIKCGKIPTAVVKPGVEPEFLPGTLIFRIGDT